MATEPVASGVVVPLPRQHAQTLDQLSKETLAILRALNVEARVSPDVPQEADFVLLLVEEGAAAEAVPLPDLHDRAGAAIALAEHEPEGRATLHAARKQLRQHGAALAARSLLFSPDQFGYLGLESDGLRERLEILLRTFALDAERLRLKREGWEEP